MIKIIFKFFETFLNLHIPTHLERVFMQLYQQQQRAYLHTVCTGNVELCCSIAVTLMLCMSLSKVSMLNYTRKMRNFSPKYGTLYNIGLLYRISTLTSYSNQQIVGKSIFIFNILIVYSKPIL